MHAHPATALASLLADLVDYAGLFPPAQLAMPDAVRAYHAHRSEPQAFMLGRFVVPAGRLPELAAAYAAAGADDGPWPLSVLTGKDLATARRAVDALLADHPTVGRLDAIEMIADDAEAIAEGARLFATAERFVEIPHDQDPESLMRTLREHGGRAKIRTGGVTAEAFPSSFELARFITTAARVGIPMKATAGLHHPLRGSYPLTYEPDSAEGTMFGFLTVFLAAALARAGVHDPEALVPLLEERDPARIVLEDDRVRWRDHALTRSQIVSGRAELARSYGSCSFAEPVADLQALGLL